jgi:hypothetical protein
MQVFHRTGDRNIPTHNRAQMHERSATFKRDECAGAGCGLEPDDEPAELPQCCEYPY